MLAAATLNPKIYIAVIFICMAIYIAYVLLKPSKKTDEAPKAEVQAEEESNELTATPAVVVSKYADAKHARHNIYYFVVFLVDGEEREVRVDRKTFERVYEGEASTLVMEGDKFLDFSDGEEITDEELAEIENEAFTDEELDTDIEE